ncbi:MAG: energy transducer TonB [Bryobacteraceae bacterium]
MIIAALAQAQPESPDSLIADVAAFARTGLSWKAAGYAVDTAEDGKQSADEIQIAYQLAPSIRARLEITGGGNPLLRVCDGTSQWTYYPHSHSYVRVILPQISPCAYPISAWPVLNETLRSPTMTGTDHVNCFGRPRACQIVRGKFLASVNDSHRQDLEVCIDPATRLIVRYQIEEANHRVHSINFSWIQRDVKLDADQFQFHPPTGSKEVAVINWLDPIAQPGNSVSRVSNEVTAPLLVNLVAPEITSEGTRSSRTIVLYCEVNGDGIPQNVKVIGPLGTGLDDRVVQAVRKWRFEPGARDGNPVTVATAIAVNF